MEDSKYKNYYIRKNIVFDYWRQFSLIYRGVRGKITEHDLAGFLKTHESKTLGDQLEESWNHQMTTKNPSLWKAILRIFWIEIVLLAIPSIAFSVICLITPLFVGQILQYYTPKQTLIDKKTVCTNVIILMGLIFFRSVNYKTFSIYSSILGMKIRLATTSIIYRKSLTLNKSNLERISTGKIVNLLSNDVIRFETAFSAIHFIWIAPIQLFAMIYMVDTYLGHVALTGLITYVLIIIVLTGAISFMRKKRLVLSKKTDTRLKIMNEIISGIQVIKMYTWEKPFKKLMDLAREEELQCLKQFEIINTEILGFKLLSNRFAIFTIVILSHFLSVEITAHYIFTALIWYDNLRTVVVILLPRATMALADIRVTVLRIKNFLLTDTTNKVTNALEEEKNKIFQGCILRVVDGKKQHESYRGVTAKNLSVHWQIQLDSILKNASFTIAPNTLTALVGETGCGKTTLIQSILNEVPFVHGELNVNGTVSYASQEPWIFSSTFKQNILFGQEWDASKYQTVVKICCLERDLEMFPFRDETQIGEKGVMLSGGQKARISLARAIYKDADIYLLDDPLSAVDVNVGGQIYQNCIQKYLRDKARLLVTHQKRYIEAADVIYSIKNGYVQLCTNLNEIKDKIDENVKEVETSKIVVCNETANQFEEKETASGKQSVFKWYFLSKNVWYFCCLVLPLIVLNEFGISLTDFYVAFIVNTQQKKEECRLNVSDCKELNPLFTPSNIYFVYFTLVVFLFGVNTIRNIVFVEYCTDTSRVLHNTMFNKVFSSTMRFFHTNASGRILNRFSVDMGTIDELIPMYLLETLQLGCNTITCLLLISYVNYWYFIPSSMSILLVFLIKRIFLRTLQKLKQTESIKRSILYSHLTSTLQGLLTIRSCQVEDILKTEFSYHQNSHTAVFYNYITCSNLFVFLTDLIFVIYLSVVFWYITYFENILSGNVGLLFSQSMLLCGKTGYFMLNWVNLDSCSNAIERIKDYTKLPQEINNEQKAPYTNWPRESTIEFKDVSVRYADENSLALNKINFSIQSGEKIGVVGRTGAGKTSLVSTMFRLYPFEGTVLIDSVDISQISLQALRSKITIIPQTPFLFSDTIRRNIDPFGDHDDETIWKSLEQVNLKRTVAEFPENLDYQIAEDGSNLSVGERQLLCLARTILQNNRIVVLDEATANLDLATDNLVQKIIRERFMECTILTIAHRLETIMDSDRVLVMDGGKVVEFDRPDWLMQNKNSAFYKLVNTDSLNNNNNQ